MYSSMAMHATMYPCPAPTYTLHHGLNSLVVDSTLGLYEAVQSIAESATQCKFEATYPAFDECVLNRILDVLVATVASPQGRLLAHDNLINIFQACYRIGHYQTEKGRETSEMLTQASRRAMTMLVGTIFSRLDSVQMEPSGSATPALLHSVTRLQVSPPATPRTDDAAQGADRSNDAVPADFGAEASAISTAAAPPGEGGPNGAAAAPAAHEVEGVQSPFVEGETPAPAPHHEIVSLLSPVHVPTPRDEDYIGEDDLKGGYGVPALCEVLNFVISFVSAPASRQQGDLPTHGLRLLATALHAAGETLAQYEPLMQIVQQDLVKSLFVAAQEASLSCLAGICQVALALYVYLGRHLLLQIEALLGLLLLPMAEGRSVASSDHQHVALEGVLDFCAQPGFVRDVFFNLDCRIERSNLFEQICTLLSKAAFPVNGPVSSLHVLSLDGIMAILSSLASSGDVAMADDDGAASAPFADPQRFVDIWTPLSQGLTPPVLDALRESTDEAPSTSASAAEMARAERHLKSRLATVAEHFNRDQKKGFQYCQSMHLLPATLDAASVARFLRACPGLSKAAIGEVVGERDAFYDGVRSSFMETFDFTGLEFHVALRLFMDAFRPPGEGQKIDRIMQVFGQRYYEQMPDAGLKNADAAYVLAFSVIMLNTDLHNTQNKRKMTFDDFARINRSTNDGQPMPRELLERIYAAISQEELRISSECSLEDLPKQLVFWDQMARQAQRPRGRMLLGAQTNPALERDMFSLVWGPTLAAASVVLDGSSDPRVARRAMEGLLFAAQLATRHGVEGVADQLLGTLAKYTAGLGAAGPKPALVYGESEKARAAVELTFAIANRYGDSIRGGWRNVLDCIVRLHKVGLLPPAILAADGGKGTRKIQLALPLLYGSMPGSTPYILF